MCDSVDIKLIHTFRSNIKTDVNQALSDNDCMRFIIARKMDTNKAAVMASEWWEWYNTPLNAYNGATPANIFTMERFLDPHEELVGDLCPHAMHGEDKAGHPIYWEKTGFAEARMDQVKQHFDMDYLIARHIRQQTIMLIRLKHCAKKHNKDISKMVVVFDLDELRMVPDLMGLDYVRKVLLLDQAYYPERLQTIYLINAPWYFAAIYALVSAFIDPVTAKKIRILTTDFLDTLREEIDDSQIPSTLGGSGEDFVWRWPYHPSSGAAPDQLRAYLTDSEGTGNDGETRNAKTLPEDMN
mmetsp:Transcript_13561/g.20355  ORF Transcript_13561/g.20355 Transcript_13561/m.20355 type:complete len:298 (+) Transcript_13561:61-954(+)